MYSQTPNILLVSQIPAAVWLVHICLQHSKMLQCRLCLPATTNIDSCQPPLPSEYSIQEMTVDIYGEVTLLLVLDISQKFPGSTGTLMHLLQGKIQCEENLQARCLLWTQCFVKSGCFTAATAAAFWLILNTQMLIFVANIQLYKSSVVDMKRQAFLLVCLQLTTCFTLSPSIRT